MAIIFLWKLPLDFDRVRHAGFNRSHRNGLTRPLRSLGRNRRRRVDDGDQIGGGGGFVDPAGHRARRELVGWTPIGVPELGQAGIGIKQGKGSGIGGGLGHDVGAIHIHHHWGHGMAGQEGAAGKQAQGKGQDFFNHRFRGLAAGESGELPGPGRASLAMPLAGPGSGAGRFFASTG